MDNHADQNTQTDGEKTDENAVTHQRTERELLEERANLMGVEFSKNIGTDTLRKRVEAAQNGDRGETGAEKRKLTKEQIKAKIAEEQERDLMKLVRISIQVLNPAKLEMPGEFITFRNRTLGSVKKFIPFDEEAAQSYHVPEIIAQILEGREYQQIKVKKGPKGESRPAVTRVKEFAIKRLEPLTAKELAELKQRQVGAAAFANGG